MLYSTTPGSEAASEKLLRASTGLGDVLESIFGSFSNPFNWNKPDPLDGKEPPADPEPETPKLERNEQWAEETPSSLGDSLGLQWYGTLPQAISEALNLAMLPKLDDILRHSTECCASISSAIDQLTIAVKEIEACCKPAAEAPVADIHKRMDEIERDIRKATEPTPLDQISSAESVLSYISGLVAGVLGLFAGLFAGLEMAHGQEVVRRLWPEPSELKNWSAERLEGLEELDRRYPKSESADKAFLDPFFAQAWREWQRALRELIENIEAPDSSQHDRDESLRVLPHVLEDVERALDMYRERHDGQEAPFDPELLDRAKDLLERTPAPEPRPEPKQRDDADLLSWEGGGRGRASQYETDPLTPASYSLDDGPARGERDRAQEQFERVLDLVESLAARLRDPVRLEVRLLDDRVIARRLDGNRSVDVDLSRGYRMVGYISV